MIFVGGDICGKPVTSGQVSVKDGSASGTADCSIPRNNFLPAEIFCNPPRARFSPYLSPSHTQIPLPVLPPSRMSRQLLCAPLHHNFTLHPAPSSHTSPPPKKTRTTSPPSRTATADLPLPMLVSAPFLAPLSASTFLLVSYTRFITTDLRLPPPPFFSSRSTENIHLYLPSPYRSLPRHVPVPIQLSPKALYICSRPRSIAHCIIRPAPSRQIYFHSCLNHHTHRSNK